MEYNRPRHFTPQMFLGLIVVFLGVIFTLSNTGVIESEDYLRYWPALLMLYGSVRIYDSRRSSGRLWGAGWFIVGTVLLLNNLYVTNIHLWDYWPLILVFIGLGMMRGSVARRRRIRWLSSAIGSESVGTDDESVISGVAILGGYRRTNNSKDFRGGELTAIMGGVELDLREASIKEGDAVLDLFAFWGGAKIRVPEDWTISLQGIPILGGFEDKTRAPRADTGKRLVIKGYAIMGGAEISN